MIFKYDDFFYEVFYEVGLTESQSKDPFDEDSPLLIECQRVRPVYRQVYIKEWIKY